MRTEFIHSLIKAAEKDSSIFLICGDLGFSVLENFRDKFPERFLNAGIAEQNMAAIAAGLAKEGFKVFLYSIGNFPSLRALEQIRYDICYHRLDVNIVSVGAGFSYGPLGCSHHATEDLAILRALPELTVYSPADPIEVQWSLDDIVSSHFPSYLRLGKAGERTLHASGQTPQPINKIVGNGNTLVLTTGSISAEAVDLVSENLEELTLCTTHALTNKVGKSLKQFIQTEKIKKIITLEESQLNGGFGSFILEQCNENDIQIPVKRLGIKNKFTDFAGSQSFLRSEIIRDLKAFALERP